MNSKYIETVKSLINDIRNEKNLPDNIEYFIQLIEDRHLNYESSEDDIAIFSNMIPEEIIRGLGLNPIWCLGGSLDIGDKYFDLFPRDVDPVVLSSYGMYMEKKIPGIIAFQNDSYRKLAWLIKEQECEIFTLDMPAIKDMNQSSEIYKQNVLTLMKDLEKRYKRQLLPYKLFKAHHDIQHSRNLMKKLIELQTSKGIFSSQLLHFILSSYYCTNDLVEYGRNLESVLNQTWCTYDKRISLGIVGSPLYFPNNKIFKITKDLGVEIDFMFNENNMFLSGYDLTECNDVKAMIGCIVGYYFNYNLIPHNIREDVSYQKYLSHLDGVIYHVLKGQISYDYDYIKLEEALELPIIRLETDYYKEDVEQIKIRLEAFIEMVSGLKAV